MTRAKGVFPVIPRRCKAPRDWLFNFEDVKVSNHEENSGAAADNVTPIAAAKVGRPALPKKYPTTAFPVELEINYRKGRYSSSLENVVAAMRCHSVTGIQLALDEFFAEEGAFVNGQ